MRKIKLFAEYKLVKSDNVVLTVAIGYGFKAFKDFILPLRSHFHGDIIVLVQENINTTIKELCEEQNITLVSTRKLDNIAVRRFSWYAKMCEGYPGYCLTTDFRDVYFQGNPFHNVPDVDLLLSEEAHVETIASCYYNSNWIRRCYGNAALEQIGNNAVLCSGVLMGNANGFNQLSQVFDAFSKNSSHQSCLHIYGMDQGILNYIWYTHRLNGLKVAVQQQGEGIVNTVGIIPKQNITQYLNIKGFVINKDESISAIVHQYDRFQVLINTYHNLTKQLEKKNH